MTQPIYKHTGSLIGLRWIFVVMFYLLLSSIVSAQNEEVEEQRKSKISLAITHTFVPTAINNNGDKTWLSLPSWALDYDYRLNSQWGLGVHSDLVIQDFEYEHGDVVRNRTKPLAMAGVATRRIGKNVSVLGGGGVEFAKGEETLGLVRLGLDYGIELPRDWEVSFSFVIDFKINAYNALVFGFGIGKKF
jgi:opacity protein-like surface antigen